MKKSIKVLMIDDDEEDFIITRDIIAEINHHQYSIEWVPEYSKGLSLILEGKHDLYLVDYCLGARVGLDLITEAKSRGCEKPFILLTGQSDIETDKKAMEAGVADFLVKGMINSRQLETSIRYSIEHSRILKEIKSLNINLERRVSERTMVLEETISELNKTKKDLSEALKKEKELNELKSRFVAMASHEFRTPLATILSSLALVSKYGEQNQKEKQEKHIGRIKSSVNHLTDLLNDVLSLSKLEEGHITLHPESFNIRELFSETIQDLQMITKSEQEINYVHSGATEIVSDKKVLRHILTNLVSNAIKFSPSGKIVKVRSEVKDKDLSIQVADRGMGISEEDQKHLFERFFRGQNATNIQGTGLGLNIVGKYVEMMQGKIECTSVLEEGTTFKVYLPGVISE